MSRKVAPVKVAPLIKTFRWTFLIFGIFYGYNKWHLLKAYEAKMGPKRKAEIKARHLKKHEDDRIRTRDELFNLAKDMEVTDFPPGWDREL